MIVARALLCLATFLVPGTLGFKTLNRASYTRLPTSINSNGADVFQGINYAAADGAAYDPINYIIYVIGTRNRLLHAIDVADPSSPMRILTHQFTEHDGNPQAVDVCGGRLAVALSAHVDVLEGHVQFFDVLVRGSSVTDIHPDHTLAVGAHPKDLKHTPNCNTVLVANEGRPGKDDTNQYLNPEGTITMIVIDRNNDPTLRTIDFRQFNEGEASFNQNIRVPSRYIPISVYSGTTTVAQDLEPESVVISNDGRYAWVTLLENDAVATLDLRTYQVTKVSPLPKKLWDTSSVDCSDLDGGVHRRTYAGLKSMRQPGKITLLQIGSKNYLLTADVGGVTSYTSALHGFTWTDTITARSLVNNLMPDLAELKTQMTDNGYLGRLQVSTIEGKSLFDPRYTHVEMFGGRGFSVWDSTNMAAPTFDSEGTLEEYMDSYFHFLFNTDYAANRATTGSPANDRDTSSENQGAFVSGLDVMEENGTVYMVAGTHGPGTLFLYKLNTASGQPIPEFQSITRSGESEDIWNTLYTNEQLGDLRISDIGMIPSNQSPTGRPLVFVTATGSGSLGLYEIIDSTPIIPIVSTS